MVVGLEKKVVFREGNCHGNRKLRGDSAKHFARAILRRNWIQTWLNLANDSISSKVIRTQTEQFLELFIRTLNFFAPLRCENIIVYYCLTERRMSLALDARVLLLHSYDRLSRIFSCRLLIWNQNIFLVQFGIQKHSSIISKTTNCNFVSLRNLTSAYLLQMLRCWRLQEYSTAYCLQSVVLSLERESCIVQFYTHTIVISKIIYKKISFIFINKRAIPALD